MENANEKILKSCIHYYCLRRLYRTAGSLASEGIRMYPGEQVYRFYFGCSLAFEGRVQEAIREMSRSTLDKDLALGSCQALLYSHRRCQVIDQEAIDKLEARFADYQKQSSEIMLYYGGLFALLSRDGEQALKYIDDLLYKFPQFTGGKILHGWYLITLADHVEPKLAQSYVDQFANITEPEVLIIRFKLLEVLGNYSLGLEQLNQAMALYSRFLPALIEKIRILAVLKEYEQLMDTAFRALVLDKHCIEPQRFLIIYYLAWNSNEELGLSRIQDLISSFELREPKNASLYYESSKLIARIALKNYNILLHSFSLIERATFLEPSNVYFICEIAFQNLLLNHFQESQRHYRNASKLDSSSLKPMTGLLLAQLMEYEFNLNESLSTKSTSDLNKIYQEIENLEELNKATGPSEELLYLCIKAKHHKRTSTAEIEKYLEDMLAIIKNKLKGMTSSVEYYTNLEVYQVMDVAQICLSYCASEPLITGEKVPVMLSLAREYVNILMNAFSNHKNILYLSSYIKYLNNEIPSALNLINRCLQVEPNYTMAHILMARISVYDKSFKTANKSLENALLLDFQIRDNIFYVVAKAAVLKSEQNFEEAELLLKNALSAQHTSAYNVNDEISIHLQLVDIYLLLKKTAAATESIQSLITKHTEPFARGRLLLALAGIHVSNRDYEVAVQTLRDIDISFGASHFIRSRQMMATIYLHKHRDHKKYIDCHREIIDQIPSTQSQLMLGDAYMNILEPDIAIEIYEQTLKKNPKDYFLVRKVGQALIKAHFYERAVTFYKAAIKTSKQNISFCFDLANLLYKLKRLEQSKETINSAVQSINLQYENDLELHIMKMKLMHLLAQAQLADSATKDAGISTLRQVYADNQKFMRSLPVKNPDLLQEQSKFSLSLCKQLAELLSTLSNDDRAALQIYKDALVYDDKNTEIYLQLAKLELQSQNYDMAHNYCVHILKHCPNLEEPILMMADITFRQADFEGALNLYNELLARRPTYYLAIKYFIEAARRSGKLTSVLLVLERAEHDSRQAKNETGLLYCKALYDLYTGNCNEAVKNLYASRDDPQFGRSATFAIIEICIHSEQGREGEVFENIISVMKFNDKLDSQQAAITTAELLLENLKARSAVDFEYNLLNHLVILARKQKSDAEYVVGELMKLMSEERYNEHSGLVFGIASAYMILKQTPKARNQLKRIAKSQWKYSEADYLERCWILLADIHIQSNKFDMANELLRRVLKYNKSCVKAYEYMGYIMEKEQSYRDAAYNYELAWLYTNNSNPMIGYKLAFNYMKAKRYTDAIDIAQAILALYPEYPKVKKDILDKCRAMLK